MKCQCGQQLKAEYKYCPSCRQSLTGQSNTIENSGSVSIGNQYQAGRDINISAPASSNEAKPKYSAVPKWRSPLTLSVLTWIGTLTGVSSLFPLWKAASPVISLLPPQLGGTSGTTMPTDSPFTPVLAVTAFITLSIITLIFFSFAMSQKNKLENR